MVPLCYGPVIQILRVTGDHCNNACTWFQGNCLTWIYVRASEAAGDNYRRNVVWMDLSDIADLFVGQLGGNVKVFEIDLYFHVNLSCSLRENDSLLPNGSPDHRKGTCEEEEYESQSSSTNACRSQLLPGQ